MNRCSAFVMLLLPPEGSRQTLNVDTLYPLSVLKERSGSMDTGNNDIFSFIMRHIGLLVTN